MIGMVRAAKDPQAAAVKLAQNNPDVWSAIQEAGGDYKKAFYNACQKKGVDPSSILSQLNNL